MDILGIDVGATGIKGAIVNLNDGQLKSERIKLGTPASKSPEDIAKVVNEIIEIHNWKGKRCGLGFPAVIKNGISLTAANINDSFIGLNVNEFFSKALSCECKIINDADAAGLAEMTFGRSKGMKGTIILLTLGTGIGSAIFRNGKLIPNTELGHLIYKDSIAEHFASNNARKKKDLTWEAFGKELNEYLSHLNLILSPDLMIIGGGVSKKFDKYKSYISENINVTTAVKLNDAGIIGAAMQFS